MARRELTDGEIDAAAERGRVAAETEPRAAGVHYDAASGRVMVELTNGCLFGFPAERAQGLRGASPEALADVRVMPGGGALQWDRLDAGFTVAGVVAGIFGTRQWMRQLAAEMGRRGGSATSEAKTAAARANGRKGGRPRKRADGGLAGGTYETGAAHRPAMMVRESTSQEPAGSDAVGADERDDAPPAPGGSGGEPR